MRHVPALAAAAALAAAVAWLCAGGAAAATGLPIPALMTFAVAAFSGPAR